MTIHYFHKRMFTTIIKAGKYILNSTDIYIYVYMYIYIYVYIYTYVKSMNF